MQATHWGEEGRGRDLHTSARDKEATPGPLCPPQHHATAHLLILGGAGTLGLPAEQPDGPIPAIPGCTDAALPPPSAPGFIPASLPLPRARVTDASTARRLPLHAALWPQWGPITGLLPRPPIWADPAAAPYRESG